MRNQIHLLIFSLLLISLMSVEASPQPPPLLSPTIRSQIEQEQAERLDQVEKSKQSLKNMEFGIAIPEQPKIENETCFNIDNIIFNGNTIFKHTTLLDQINFTPGCFGLSEINNILRVITNLYVESGYVTSRAFLVPQDLSSGQLEIVIMEGKLEALLFNGVYTRDL